jgi:hypothetical protein
VVAAGPGEVAAQLTAGLARAGFVVEQRDQGVEVRCGPTTKTLPRGSVVAGAGVREVGMTLDPGLRQGLASGERISGVAVAKLCPGTCTGAGVITIDLVLCGSSGSSERSVVVPCRAGDRTEDVDQRVREHLTAAGLQIYAVTIEPHAPGEAPIPAFAIESSADGKELVLGVRVRFPGHDVLGDECVRAAVSVAEMPGTGWAVTGLTPRGTNPSVHLAGSTEGGGRVRVELHGCGAGARAALYVGLRCAVLPVPWRPTVFVLIAPEMALPMAGEDDGPLAAELPLPPDLGATGARLHFQALVDSGQGLLGSILSDRLTLCVAGR